jgi:nitric oxide reductase subunit B
VLTYYTYSDEPPIPEAVKHASGVILFTHADVMAGQGIFLRNGLMAYGSVFGHGAYLGPDFTAEYLRRAALTSIAFYEGSNSNTARTRTIDLPWYCDGCPIRSAASNFRGFITPCSKHGNAVPST